MPPARRRHLPRVRRPRARRPPRDFGDTGRACRAKPQPPPRRRPAAKPRGKAGGRRLEEATPLPRTVFQYWEQGAPAVPAAGGRREPCDEPGVALHLYNASDAPRLVSMPSGRTGARAGARSLASRRARCRRARTSYGTRRTSARWRVPRHQGAHSHAARRRVRAPARRLWSRGARLARGVGPFVGPRYLVSWGLAAPAGRELVTILNAIAGNILGDHRAVATLRQQRLTGKRRRWRCRPLMLSSA